MPRNQNENYCRKRTEKQTESVSKPSLKRCVRRPRCAAQPGAPHLNHNPAPEPPVSPGVTARRLAAPLLPWDHITVPRAARKGGPRVFHAQPGTDGDCTQWGALGRWFGGMLCMCKWGMVSLLNDTCGRLRLAKTLPRGGDCRLKQFCCSAAAQPGCPVAQLQRSGRISQLLLTRSHPREKWCDGALC